MGRGKGVLTDCRSLPDAVDAAACDGVPASETTRQDNRRPGNPHVLPRSSRPDGAGPRFSRARRGAAVRRRGAGALSASGTRPCLRGLLAGAAARDRAASPQDFPRLRARSTRACVEIRIFYGAFFLNRRAFNPLHAIDTMPARWRGWFLAARPTARTARAIAEQRLSVRLVGCTRRPLG